jgi:leucine-rich repeat protein SHOC2
VPPTHSGSLPAELGKLTKLVSFWVSNNQLTGIMSVMGAVTLLLAAALTNLHCVPPPPGSLPAELGKLTKLEDFRVAQNQLTGMMSGMGAVALLLLY